MPPLGTRDLRALLDVVAAIGYDADTDAVAVELVDLLTTLVDSIATSYVVHSSTAPVIFVERYVTRAPEPEPGPWQDVFWDLVDDFPIFAAPQVPARVLFDVTTRRQLRRNAFFNEWSVPSGLLPQGMLRLPDRPDGAQRRIMFNTEVAARPFGARQRAILETVWPYVWRPIEAADAVRRRQRAAGLTPRELDVLRAVREGLTNDAIAARLVVSEGTVRKHLEHVSAKLGARTRAEAVALAWR